MSRLSVPNLESDTGPSGQIYAQIKKAIGSVPNTFAAIAAHDPAALQSVLAADAVLAAGTLTKRDQEVIKLVISAAGGCDYCVAAHNHLAGLAGLKPEVLKQIRDGQPTGDSKRDALVGFVRKLAQFSGTVSDDDFAAIKAAGYSDAQLVEISLAFATTVFTNVFNRINVSIRRRPHGGQSDRSQRLSNVGSSLCILMSSIRLSMPKSVNAKPTGTTTAITCEGQPSRLAKKGPSRFGGRNGGRLDRGSKSEEKP
jgi:uncharacterized peroxidase-related enzyme